MSVICSNNMTFILFYLFKILNNDRTSKKNRKRSDKCNGGNPHTECCDYDKPKESNAQIPLKAK